MNTVLWPRPRAFPRVVTQYTCVGWNKSQNVGNIKKYRRTNSSSTKIKKNLIKKCYLPHSFGMKNSLKNIVIIIPTLPQSWPKSSSCACLLFFWKNFFALNWCIVNFQCGVNFMCTVKWFFYIYILSQMLSIISYYKILSIIPCTI